MANRLTTTIDLDDTRRGDNYPFQFTVTGMGDITGLTFTMTVDPNPDPDDDTTKEFQLTGVVTDGAGGKFEFRPTTANMDLTPDTYYYDVQVTDGSGYVITLIAGKLPIVQDITKL